MPMYSPTAARAKAINVVHKLVADFQCPLTDAQLAGIVEAVARDLEYGVSFAPVETRVAESLAAAVKAAQDEMQSGQFNS